MQIAKIKYMLSAFKDYLQKHNYSSFDMKAVLFDMDGVLYDSMKYHAKAWKAVMDEEGLDSTYEEYFMHEGRVGYSTIDLVIQRNKGRHATEEEKQRIYKRKSELFAIFNDGELIPYAYDLLKAVKGKGLQCIVVTGSGQPSLLDNLDNNFRGIFNRNQMVTAFDVKNGKPHPEPYLMGLEKGGHLKANQAIVVENAPMGIEAAVAAGLFTVAVNTGPLDEKVLWDAGADIVLPSMEALFRNWESYAKELSL